MGNPEWRFSIINYVSPFRESPFIKINTFIHNFKQAFLLPIFKWDICLLATEEKDMPKWRCVEARNDSNYIK